MALRDRLFEFLRRRLEGVPLRIVLWDGERIEFSDAPLITVTLHARRLGRLLLTGNMAGLGAAYVSGELSVEGEVEDILKVGVALAERVGHTPVLRHSGR